MTTTRTPWMKWLAASALVLLAFWLAGTLISGDTPPSGAPPVAGSDSDLVQQGEYLARIGNCAHCHTARGGEAFAGGRAIDTPFGAVVSGNITPDKLYGIGSWTQEDFWRAMHHGKSRDGRLLYPAFPYTSYTRLTRSDANALYAYLLSLPPATRSNEEHRLRWPYSTQTALWVWRTLYFRPHETPAASAMADRAESPLARGEYLVEGLGHCQECHSARNALGAMEPGDRGSILPQGRWYAPSLRVSTEAGVGGWTDAEVVSLLRSGTSARGSVMGPMAEVVLHGTQYLTEKDALSMAHYLRGLDRSAATPATRPANTPPVSGENGARLYERHCADCHGNTGQGRVPAYPPLAGNRTVNLVQPNNAIHAVLHGGFAPATAGNPRPYGMPPFVLSLDDRQAAEVLTYIRSSWGNSAPAVSEFDINSLRR